MQIAIRSVLLASARGQPLGAEFPFRPNAAHRGVTGLASRRGRRAEPRLPMP
jgi:hypothetical protein